jgi:hypothetical protein
MFYRLADSSHLKLQNPRCENKRELRPREGLQQRAAHGGKPDSGGAQRSRWHAQIENKKSRKNRDFVFYRISIASPYE